MLRRRRGGGEGGWVETHVLQAKGLCAFSHTVSIGDPGRSSILLALSTLALEDELGFCCCCFFGGIFFDKYQLHACPLVSVFRYVSVV